MRRSRLSRWSRIERGAGVEQVRSGGVPRRTDASTENWTTTVAKLCDVVHLANVVPKKHNVNVGYYIVTIDTF